MYVMHILLHTLLKEIVCVCVFMFLCVYTSLHIHVRYVNIRDRDIWYLPQSLSSLCSFLSSFET